jgi:hypothetical protein
MGAGMGAGVTTYCGAGVITARGWGGEFDAMVGGTPGPELESIVDPTAMASIGAVAFFTETRAAGCGAGMTGANEVCPYESTPLASGVPHAGHVMHESATTLLQRPHCTERA